MVNIEVKAVIKNISQDLITTKDKGREYNKNLETSNINDQS